MKKIEDKIHYLEKELERLLNWIQGIESKINLVITLSTAMLGVLAILASEINEWNCEIVLFTSTSTGTLLLGLIFIALASFPRTKGPTGSLIYFGEIQDLELDVYDKKVRELDEEKYVNDLIKQCHRNAQIATIKYSWVKKSILCLFISAVPWLISIYLLYNNT